MAGHKVYEALVSAVKDGRLKEPFGEKEFQASCPGLGAGTYHAFLYKHCKGNPAGNSELLRRVSPGHFKLLRPFRYGL
jgi:hypothetical protein